MKETTMYLLETLKKTFEQDRCIGSFVAAKRMPACFRDDGATPNNPTLPFIHYRSPVRLTNPRTGGEVVIPAQRVMLFRASDTLKKLLAAGRAND
jgi:hypothetical protein